MDAFPLTRTTGAGGDSRWRRIALGVIAPLGPLAMAGWAVSTPSSPGMDNPAAVAAIAADPVGTQWGLLFLILAGAFGAAGSLVTGGAIQRGAPRLGAAAACIAFLGFCIAAYPGPVASIAAAPAAGLDAAQMLTLVAVVDAQLQGIVVGILFVALPAGILLLGIAALVAARRGKYRWGSAIVLTVAIPLVLLGGFFASWAMALGWIVVAVGYGLAGWEFTAPSLRYR